MATPINIKFPLAHSPKGAFATNDTTHLAVLDDLKILLLTNYGERPIHWDFGANIRPLLFELKGPDLFQAVQDAVLTAVEKWMPFVNVVNLDVADESTDPTLGPNQIQVRLEFTVGKIEIVSTLTQRISL